jgi:hypothetical protein
MSAGALLGQLAAVGLAALNENVQAADDAGPCCGRRGDHRSSVGARKR